MNKNNKKILFVEDEEVLRDTLRESLEAHKLKVETASDGQEALSLLKNNEYDLILLDIILPKKDGFEILKVINKKVPVILLTNLSGFENVQKALDLGARNYLVKSEYKLEEIVERVKEVIG